MRRLFALVMILVIISMLMQTSYASVNNISNIGSAREFKYQYANKTQYLEDIDSSQYHSSIELVISLGIMPNISATKFSPLNTVSRGEFADLIIGVLGLKGAAIYNNDISFTDVSEDNESAISIKIAAVMGLMEGYANNEFCPDEPITYNQAVKVILKALGYEAYAENNGGYPLGWLNAASQFGLTKGTLQNGEGSLTREVTAKLLDNAMDINLLNKVAVNKRVEYIGNEDKNILTEYMNLIKIEGIIEKNYYTALTGESTLNSGDVEINGTVYNAENTDLVNRIGENVIAYVINDDHVEKPKVVAVRGKSKYNNKVIISADNIDLSTTTSKFSYIDDNKIRKLTVSKSVYLIYNGKAKINWSKNDIMPEEGSVTLIDQNNDDEYDVIKVNDVKDLVADRISTDKNSIHFKFQDGGWSLIELGTKDDLKFNIIKNNKSATINDINEWSIVSVASSFDKKYFNIIISDNKVTGKVDEIGDDYLIVDGIKYSLSNCYKGNADMYVPELGDECIFYINYEGKVSSVKTNLLSGAKYGYLVDAEKSKGVANEVSCKIFTDSGLMKIFKCADKMELNDAKPEKSSTVIQNSLFWSNATFVPQLITYELNSDFRIKSISTAVDSKNLTDTEKDNKFTFDGTFATVVFRGGTQNLLATRYQVSSDTKIFVVPDDTTSDNTIYRITDRSYFSADKTYKNINLYDVTSDNIVNLILVKTSTSSYINNNSPVAVVEKVKSAINTDGEEVSRLFILSSGKELTLDCKESDMTCFLNTYALTNPEKETKVTNNSGTISVNTYMPIKDLNEGDIIQYGVDSNGKLDSVRVLFRVNSQMFGEKLGTSNAPSENDCYSDLYYAFGKVEKVISNGIIFIVPVTSSAVFDMTQGYFTRVHPSNGANLYLYDSGSQKIRAINKNDIIQGDKVLVYVKSSVTKLFVIYR